LDLQTDIAKFKDTVRKFRQEQRDESSEDDDGTQGQPRPRERGHGIKGRSIFRGPRKAAEPTGDIRARMGKASQAFIEENYEEAKALVEEVIRINAETHEAWTLLASIFRELGDRDKTLLALIYAAHLRPKDAAQWLNVARFALEETGDQRSKNLPSAKFCFSSAIRANPKDDFEARCGKAAVLREMGSTKAAIAEYRQILKQRPHDTGILRLIAEAYIDRDNVKSAQELYKESIAFYKSSDDEPGEKFTWSDANIYVELYAYVGLYADAIKELRSLSRWLLGRESESYWDEVFDDDREWDPTDERRLLHPNFLKNRYSPLQYGDGLPLELRVKLGLYRLKLGFQNEALVG
jgi:general transcription factor 3C polypeptide 3 (transcription factor C subunit 4)